MMRLVVAVVVVPVVLAVVLAGSACFLTLSPLPLAPPGSGHAQCVAGAVDRADVLFVVDNSGTSMVSKQAPLDAAFFTPEADCPIQDLANVPAGLKNPSASTLSTT